MYTFDLRRILIGDLPLLFFVEIVLRTAILYFYALLIFRALGKRSIGELTPLELIVVIGLGSAVGDPMFYPDVPLLHGIAVITVVALIQRAVIFFTRRHEKAEEVFKGSPVRIVVNGCIDVQGMRDANLSREEVFMTLRQHGYQQLGEVQRVYMETDGKVSHYEFEDEDVRPGLSLMPPWDVERPEQHEAGDSVPTAGYYGCLVCGKTMYLDDGEAFPTCPRCGSKTWIWASQPEQESRELDTKRTAG
jgi:uncharacterized membrane protein YcaP (DUF421 family)